MATSIGVVIGAVVVLAALSDLVTTAVAPSLHGGWLTRRVGVVLWSGARRLLRGSRRMLQLTGLGLVLGLVGTWIVSLLLGWTLVLHGAADLRSTVDRAPADWSDTLYYAGYTLSTMGNGDFGPSSAVGQALTVIAAVTGLLALTMAITYLIPVMRAASDRRELATTIHAIGASPARIAEGLWPDRRTGQHDDIVFQLAQSVRRITQAHSSYPVLHFFTARDRDLAVAPNVAALDEALAHVVGDEPQSARLPERALHEAISSLLDALMASFVRVDVHDTPPAPAVHGDEPATRAERRRRLAAWCNDDGWTWEQAMDADGARHPAPA